MGPKPKIAILENFTLIRDGIKIVLEREGFEIAGETGDWIELSGILKKSNPDILLFDLVHYEDSGIETLEKVRKVYPQTLVVVITNEKFSDYYRDLILMGICGMVFSDAPLSELVKAIVRVAEGHQYYPESVFKVFRDYPPIFQSPHSLQHTHEILTSRELTILRLFCNGMTYKEIAQTLFISPRTVETHRNKIFDKLKIRSTAELVRYAMLHHLV
jgi:DNA-binding NarL/FixJ family response regulator